VRSLLDAPSPAVLTTYRKDGSALVSPVWFRWSDGVFEVVIAKGDLKLRHLAHILLKKCTGFHAKNFDEAVLYILLKVFKTQCSSILLVQ